MKRDSSKTRTPACSAGNAGIESSIATNLDPYEAALAAARTAARINFLNCYERALDLNRTMFQRLHDIDAALGWNEILIAVGAPMEESYLTKLKP